MSVTHIDIDPDGDTLIILPHHKKETKPETNTENPDSQEDSPQSCYKVSMKHLILASPRAKKMFGGNFAEAQPDEYGLRRWTFEPIFDPDAFEIVMNAIHGHTHKLPRTVSLNMLVYISVIVDDLDCAQSLWFFAKTWISQFSSTLHIGSTADWILISFVFDEPSLFKSKTESAIVHGKGPFQHGVLPIRPKIIETIDTNRKVQIRWVIAKLDLLIGDIQKRSDCTHECKSLVVGALMLELMSAKLIFPSPSEPFQNLSLGDIRMRIAKFKLPNVYRPTERYSKDSDFPKDLWLFQDATKEDPDKHRRGYYNSARFDTHDCALRTMVTSSLAGLLMMTSGMDLSSYR